MLGWAGSAYAANPLTPAERAVCKSVKHCVDIVETHPPDAYDYAVLHGEFLRFGDKGKTALLRMLSATDKTDMRRAQNLLVKGRFQFMPDEQRAIAAMWPRGDLDTHATIMRQALSPLMRARMIDTLSHKDAKVRQISREIIAATVEAEMDFPLRPADYGKLARAVLSEPTPALVELLSTFDAAKTAPIFTRLLKSGDIRVTRIVYEKLFEQDPKAAFENLVSTIYELTDEDTEAAIAIAFMLQDRHEDRADGFYLKFAKDIAEDPKLSPAGRLAGFHAIMNKWSGVKNAPVLASSPLMLENLEYALDRQEVFPRFYVSGFYDSAKDNPDPWLSLMWTKLSKDAYANPYTAEDFLTVLGTISSSTSRGIVTEALSDKRDFGLINLGMKASVMQGDKSRLPQLKTFLSHPINDVKVMAKLAIDALENEAETISDKAFMAKLKDLNQISRTCRIEPIDFRADVKRLPYFDLGVNPVTLTGTKRKAVSTIMPTQDGWLIGYDAGEWGGGLDYYENESGKGQALLSYKNENYSLLQNIVGILPVKPVPLGRYSTEFWAIAYNGGFTTDAAVFRISETDNKFTLTRHAQLPHRGMNVAQTQTGDVIISFDKFDKTAPHPPLLLSPNGAIRQACSPKADTAEALP